MFRETYRAGGTVMGVARAMGGRPICRPEHNAVSGFDRGAVMFPITKSLHAYEIGNTRGFDSFPDFVATCILSETSKYAHRCEDIARRFRFSCPNFLRGHIPRPLGARATLSIDVLRAQKAVRNRADLDRAGLTFCSRAETGGLSIYSGCSWARRPSQPPI
jgi:hypothetical protein